MRLLLVLLSLNCFAVELWKPIPRKDGKSVTCKIENSFKDMTLKQFRNTCLSAGKAGRKLSDGRTFICSEHEGGHGYSEIDLDASGKPTAIAQYFESKKDCQAEASNIQDKALDK